MHPPSAPSAPASQPKLYRSTDGRLAGGVARGLADHLGVDVLLVRAVFVVLVFAGGAGLALYAAFWVFVPTGPPALDPTGGTPPDHIDTRGQVLALAALTIGGVLAVQWLGVSIPGALLWPLALTAFGALLLWRQADEAQRDSWRRAVGQGRPPALLTTVGGAALVLAGGATFLAYHGRLREVGRGLVGTLVVVAGLAVITGPWWLGTVRALAAERRARIREHERAELAAHLHDSVLHTLALIQRSADEPREVQRLARSQERELRAWLNRPTPEQHRDFAAALEGMAAEVEEAHATAIELVVVGDCGLDDALHATLQAAREAMVNAAKHAGCAAISVYAEVEQAQVTVFVRDRGQGFDLATVPSDRLGVRESILGRMERHGGKAFVRSEPGAGTEVRLEMPAMQAART